MAAFVVAVAVLLGLLATAGHDAVTARRAQRAADAAALAAAPAPPGASTRAIARELAQRNDATLIAVRRNGGDVIVTVRVDHVVATARARAAPRADQGRPVD